MARSFGNDTREDITAEDEPGAAFPYPSRNRQCFRAMARKRVQSERVDPGQLAADHQLVHGLGAL
ncbi:MAG: hypothetical protein J7507_02870, partial [Pseudoxanthomonas sp.]|nr:hypothetical protein [Pseudoxanthomonas sp.]